MGRNSKVGNKGGGVNLEVDCCSVGGHDRTLRAFNYCMVEKNLVKIGGRGTNCNRGIEGPN